MDSEYARIEHLKLIQRVVDRLARSSFTVKAAASTIAAALAAAMAATSSPAIGFGGLSLVGLWGLDAYYLSAERRFRTLYDSMRVGPASECGSENYFSMATHPKGWQVVRAATSSTLLALYLPVISVVVAVATVTLVWA